MLFLPEAYMKNLLRIFKGTRLWLSEGLSQECSGEWDQRGAARTCPKCRAALQVRAEGSALIHPWPCAMSSLKTSDSPALGGPGQWSSSSPWNPAQRLLVLGQSVSKPKPQTELTESQAVYSQ